MLYCIFFMLNKIMDFFTIPHIQYVRYKPAKKELQSLWVDIFIVTFILYKQANLIACPEML
jgi:hypothetical protein